MTRYSHSKLILLLTICFLFTIFQSCEKSETQPTDAYSYYPLELGTYQIYQVTETTYSASQTQPLITSYQEKDEVDRVLSNTDNQDVYVIARYKRTSIKTVL